MLNAEIECTNKENLDANLTQFAGFTRLILVLFGLPVSGFCEIAVTRRFKVI